MASRSQKPEPDGLPTLSLSPELVPPLSRPDTIPPDAVDRPTVRPPRPETDPGSETTLEPEADAPLAPRRDSTSEQPDDEKTQVGQPSSPPPPTAPKRGPTLAQRLQDKHRRDPRIGQVLAGRYRLERLIAKGGMGRVYLATQIPLDRAVAVKVLKHEFQESDPNFVRRFFLEASTCARLTHPNVITVHDYGEDEASGELFMAMEYIEGVPLSYAIGTGGPFVAERVLNIGIQIGRALREAHDKGIIHRDLKPGNVMLLDKGDEPDAIKVLDFGLAKLVGPKDGESPFGSPDGRDGETDLTKSGTLLGSPRYMSPEQIKGEPLDPRTDIYSLGVILYQMAAGRPPFLGETSVDIIYKHLHEKPAPISEVSYAVDCPPELELVIEKCLEKKREVRFQTMSEVIGALKAARQVILGAPLGESGAGPNDSAGSLAGALRERTTNPPRPSTKLARQTTQTGPLDPEATGPEPAEAAFQERGLEKSGPLPPPAAVARSRTPLWIGLGLVGAAVLALAAVLLRDPGPEEPERKGPPPPVPVVTPPVPQPVKSSSASVAAPPVPVPVVAPAEIPAKIETKAKSPKPKKTAKKTKKRDEDSSPAENFRQNPY